MLRGHLADVGPHPAERRAQVGALRRRRRVEGQDRCPLARLQADGGVRLRARRQRDGPGREHDLGPHVRRLDRERGPEHGHLGVRRRHLERVGRVALDAEQGPAGHEAGGAGVLRPGLRHQDAGPGRELDRRTIPKGERLGYGRVHRLPAGVAEVHAREEGHEPDDGGERHAPPDPPPRPGGLRPRTGGAGGTRAVGGRRGPGHQTKRGRLGRHASGRGGGLRPGPLEGVAVGLDPADGRGQPGVTSERRVEGGAGGVERRPLVVAQEVVVGERVENEERAVGEVPPDLGADLGPERAPPRERLGHAGAAGEGGLDGGLLVGRERVVEGELVDGVRHGSTGGRSRGGRRGRPRRPGPRGASRTRA